MDDVNEVAASPAIDSAPAWHALSAEEALRRLGTSGSGLTTEEVQQRRERFGANLLPQPRRRGALERFLAQFRNVLIYVLLASAAVTAALGEWEDSCVILAVVLLNAVIGFIQEGKAEAALDAIRSMLSPQATVVRDGARTILPAEELVPGDLVFVQSGDRLPADLRLIEVAGLRCDEAALTGESVPVEKDAAPVPAEAALGDRRSMAYSSTIATFGQATGVVVATGAATEIGRIGKLLQTVETLDTPLTRQLAGFARQLTVIILAVAAGCFAFGTLVWGFAPIEMFMAAVGLAVAAIPEGLPAILTIALAVGVQRMARRHAIIRHLPSVETLGSVTVVCTDKTGTLTRNEMTVRTLATAAGHFAVTGTGYAPEGRVDGADGPASTLLVEMARAGLLCNEARLEQASEGWRVVGDPTEGALVVLARKLGLDPEAEAGAWGRRATLPFESERQFMATVHGGPDGPVLIVKGAVERVLPMCRAARDASGEIPLDVGRWERATEDIARQGQRLLAVAVRPLPSGDVDPSAPDALRDLVLLGLFGLIDPPRPEAVSAVARCRQAGIDVKMITGDHAVTACAIAREVGLANSEAAITGTELATLDEATLAARVRHVDVFARVAPEQKLRLVEALQRNGEIVAMTGDGVNDAPALKRADIGIAMGARGTEAAKEAARMVLADDNFASIEAAIEEGRIINDNLRKAIVFNLPANGGQAASLILAILAGTTLPITPIQVLWVNMVSAVTLGLALAFEPGESAIMERPPRRNDAPLLGRQLLWRVLLVSLLLAAGALGAFFIGLWAGAEVERARTLAVNTLVAMEVFYLLSCQRLAPPWFRLGELRRNPVMLMAIGALIVFQLLFTYAPPFQALFETVPLTPLDWLLILVPAAAVLPLSEWSERRLGGSQ